MEMEDTVVSVFWFGLLVISGFVDLGMLEISDIGSGNYEPANGQTLPPPVTNYGATGR